MKAYFSDLLHRKWVVDESNEICPAVINWYGTLGPVNQASSNSQVLHHKRKEKILSHVHFLLLTR